MSTLKLFIRMVDRCFILIILILTVISCGHPIIEIDDDDYDEIYQELLSEIENASEYDDYIDLTDDEIYALADYLIPFVIKQIEKRGNDAIEFYYSND